MSQRILLVDDEPGVTGAVRRSLGRDRYEYLISNNPVEAVELLRTHSVDLIVSDYNMPEMNGLELMREARLLQPDAVRILLTGVKTMDVVVAAINEGEVHRFVCKPFQTAELREMVAAGLERQAELARSNAAALRVEAEHAALESLRARHPGIDELDLDGLGSYVLDLGHIHELAVRLDLGGLMRMSATVPVAASVSSALTELPNEAC